MTSAAKKILIVVTSHAKLGDTEQPTGFWLEELAAPYVELSRSGAQVDIASPAGGKPPVDPKSEVEPSEHVRAFLADASALDKLARTRPLSELHADYDAVFVAGGHGVMWDLASSRDLARLLGDTFARGAVVAAVCHGPAALAQMVLPDGSPFVRGRRVTGFCDEEERAVGLAEVVPFLIESRFRELGANYERGPAWQSYVVRDGQLVTGQNPASSAATARAVLEALSS
jgi:putative intracellular protease/amidase